MITAIILAGGMGTRLRSAVPDLPKPMAPIRKRPFLEHQMDYWISQGVSKFVLSVGYKKEVIQNYFGQHYRGVPVKYAVENEPLGTGGGLLMAMQGVRDTCLVINGDTFFEVNLVKLYDFHLNKRSDWTFSLFNTNEKNRYLGIDINEEAEINSLNSQSTSSNSLANGGVYIINPSVLNKTKYIVGNKLSLENDLIPDLIHKGVKLYGYEFFGKFIDIGIPEDYFRAKDVLPI